MSKASRATSWGLLGALLVWLVTGSTSPVVLTEHSPGLSLNMPVGLETAIQQSVDSLEEYVSLDFMTDTADDRAKLAAFIESAGGEVLETERTHVRAKLPVASAGSLQSAPARSVGVNGGLGIEAAQVTPLASSVTQQQAQSLTRANFTPIGLDSFAADHPGRGLGIVVAVIDSGVDPYHPALRQTPDGLPKIIDWKDFTREGYVSPMQPVTWSESFTASDGRVFLLPAAPRGSTSARFGYLDEHNVTGYVNQDLNRNGLKIDRFGVLLMSTQGTEVYDTVLVDSNNDGSFRDEVPLRSYAESGSYAQLGDRQGRLAPRRLNIGVAAADPAGGWVKLGFDGLGHGTQVAGVLGGYEPDGFQGVAPGIQIMALKAIKSTGAGDWFDIKDAILYAAKNGAHIINLSVGGLAAGSAKAFDTGASEWLNQVARDYGVLIVLAADNNGPGLSSGATLGNPSSVLAVGAYYSPEMWLRDYGWTVPQESVWFFSGIGPRSDGSYLPSVIAPGGSTAPSPYWRDATGYATAVGTSIATPHVSGAAALLMEAARQQGFSHEWQSVKRSLELGARKLTGYGAYEQGHGLIQLRPALSHLSQLTLVPAIQARLADGSGGLLARSYAPGSASFALTNLDGGLARVGIFASEPWVRPVFSSMALQGGVSRDLPLEIRPPNDQGVHSAFLMVTHQNRYGPGIYLPITYVRPSELTAANNYMISRSQSLEPARHQRYFVSVPPGMTGLTVSAHLTQVGSGSSGTVQVHVFRPDGKAVHSTRIGASGDGPGTLFRTADPVEGVWEIVVVALPDQSATPASPSFAMEVRSSPGAVSGLPLRFAVPAGSVTTHSLKLTNVFGAFTGAVETMGLALTQDTAMNDIPWRVEQRLQSTVETFTLREFTDEFRVEIRDPIPADADLSLYLYRLDDLRGWELRGQSITAGTSSEAIHLRFLPSGTYKVMVTGNSEVQPHFQYRRFAVTDKLNLTLQDAVQRRGPGEVWTPSLTIKAPQQPGRYRGYVLIRDTEQARVLGWYPIEVTVGLPQVSLVPRTPQLTRERLSTVVFEVRNGATGRLIADAVVTANGQRYVSRNGLVSIPVVPNGATFAVDVQVDLPTYQNYQQRFTFPVKDNWGFHPVGVDQNQENTNWWRKLTSQLP